MLTCLLAALGIVGRTRQKAPERIPVHPLDRTARARVVRDHLDGRDQAHGDADLVLLLAAAWPTLEQQRN